jgi:hypothetical protein
MVKFFSIREWKRGSVLIVLALFLSACSAKLLYRNLDWFMLEFIEDYVSLDSDQEELLEIQLEELAQWHQKYELPEYQKQLQILYEKDLSTVDNIFLVEQEQGFRQHIKRLAEKVTPDLYLLARSMSNKQVDEFIGNLDKQHQEYVEKSAELTEIELREQYKERIEKNLDRWLGDILPEQQVIVVQWANSIADTRQDWSVYRLALRDRIKTLFTRKDDPFFFQNELTTLINHPELGYSDSLNLKLANNRKLANLRILELISTLSEQQQHHFKVEVEEWLELVKKLQI